MSEPTPSNTLTLAVQSLDGWYPVVADDAFAVAIAASQAGGAGTQSYFDAQNRTADFWSLLAAGEITFADGTDPQGRPVAMASSGNVELRVQAVATGAADGPVGTLTITTRETGTGVQRRMTGQVVVAANPSALVVDASVFLQLLPSLYASAEAMLVKLAETFAAASRVESPNVDAESLAAQALFWASKKVMGLSGSFAQWLLEYSVVTWGELALETAGVGALIAIPMIVEFLGHRMRHSVLVQNLTATSFGWQQWLSSGESALSQPVQTLAAQASGPDPLQPGLTLTLSDGANLQYLNSSDWGDIGYVLSLIPAGSGPQARVLFSIPFSGDNVMWVGQSQQSPQQVFDDHASTTSPTLSSSAEVGDYRVSISLNRLSGTTDDAYFYCSTVVIAPR